MDLSAAPATYALIVANLIASLYGLIGDRQFISDYSFNVGAIVRQKQHYRIFTSSFLHVDFFHLFINMYTLLIFGPYVEARLGTDGFLVVYFGAILASGIISYYVNKHNVLYSSIGASDAVSGVVLSFCLFEPFAPLYIMFIPIGVPAILYGALFMIISAQLMGKQGKIIAHEGHLGGAIAGVILTLMMRPEIITQFFS